MPNTPPKKKLTDYKQERPQQLSLFAFENETTPYSNTIELYDAVPKYVELEKRKTKELSAGILERPFTFRGQKYVAIITAALIKDSKEENIFVFPSQREELIEDALRKIATQTPRGVLLDDQMGVIFSLYELQKELESRGHTYNLTDLKEGLDICNKTILEIKKVSDNGTTLMIRSLFFETMGLRTKKEWAIGGSTKAFVRFHPLVTKSVLEGTYRQYNYEICMSYRLSWARWLHKRISHVFKQASSLNPYHILFSTALEDSARSYQRIADGLRAFRAGLAEMKEKGILLQYKEEKIFSTERTNRLEDVKFILYPSSTFSSEMRLANQRQGKILDALNSAPSLPSGSWNTDNK